MSEPDPVALNPSDLARARELIRAAERVAVLTGAGISAESGIPTFREAQTGHWARFRPEDLASPAAYRRDPEMVWQWYAGRARDVQAAAPNPGHTALAELERRKGEGFLLATQNVDGLHARAGSERLIELHGNLAQARCERCAHVQPWPGEATAPPPCPVCGATLRPNVVWFGEYLPSAALEASQLAFAQADLALVIGTSSLVEPAASLPLLTLRGGGAVTEINPDQTPISALVTLRLAGRASQVLPALLEDYV
ncbi:NAD-dependent deacylase [Deinococcus sp.]|uniref:SIR2 family NAD-dependent protein deacylase n=1 Tax=Deinococcus sp. TaxID=47478 RepID=UPI0025F2634E|nr:NAD-dependent deacylase [Deinococcus sp.]